MFPNRKLWGFAYKPNIALGKINNQYLLVLRYVSPTTYASFDEESILLLKLENDSIIRMPIYTDVEVIKDYQTEWNSSLKQYSHFYITNTCFVLDDEFVKRIANNDVVIKKVRVSFTNGDIEDWEIDQNYQLKLTKGLIESYQKVEAMDAIRKEKINDVESGF